ncbi:hypothetical protein BST81_08260 [Leptolyngbya sp. 'hensonii']|uniref:sensor domain-containing protein n=1 Tax=Leptolyngbya sp. 'hensonii' TaxID=1922337 RepID=UPI00094F76D6|nr:EAL domain-containing protein [Leptolyngbya sp. 'hensonii']OLP18899.1 hypothetical protein BST81_08260 [Leptolyngbya sp. 'hensonii']
MLEPPNWDFSKQHFPENLVSDGWVQAIEGLTRNLCSEPTTPPEYEQEETSRRQIVLETTESEDFEAFLQLVLDNLPLFIFWKDRNSVYLGCNQRFAHVAGFAHPRHIFGKTDDEMPWRPEEREAFLALDRLVMETNTPRYNVIESQRTADGRQTWSETSKIPLRDATGQVIGILGIFQDITERKQAEESLQVAEAKYRSIFENAVEGIFQTTADGQYLIANPMLARIYGYESVTELVDRLTDIQHQLYVDPTRRETFMQLMRDQGAVWGFESQVYRKDGSIIWISESARALKDETGQLLGYEGTVEDITDRKQVEAELLKRDNLLQAVAEATNYLLTAVDFGVAINKTLETLGQAADVDRVYIYENHLHPETTELAMSMRFEWTRPGIEPSITQSHWQNRPYSTFQQMRWYETLAAGQSVHGLTQDFPPVEREILDRDQIRSILLVPILVDDQFWGYIGFDDCRSERRWFKSEESILVAMAISIGGVLKREQAETTIRYQAFHDLLTGLPNRAQFNTHLPASLLGAQQTGQMLAVMFLDLDHFKTINDTLGHAIGDKLLQVVASRLAACLREGDVISRWGGDEFTLLLPRIVHPEDATKIAQRILEALKPPFQIEAQELYISSSIGIALYPTDGEDVQTLLRNADAALYCAKEQGRNNYQFYTPVLTTRASELLNLESRLHQALELGEFILHYQPQINLKTGKVSRMEALVRWQHPELGLIPPKRFIPLAEDSGLIVAIDEWVLETACQQIRIWQQSGLSELRMAVNLSARHFQRPGLVSCIQRILQETQLKPAHLELEMTETTVMQNVEVTIETLHQLHSLGIHISLDDFGAGYSSLGYLKKFPLHTLKIDRSFICDLKANSQDFAIISAIITLAQGLGLDVVAEGVETPDQLELLRVLNCKEVQGYLISPPLSLTEATLFLHHYDQSWIYQDHTC